MREFLEVSKIIGFVALIATLFLNTRVKRMKKSLPKINWEELGIHGFLSEGRYSFHVLTLMLFAGTKDKQRLATTMKGWNSRLIFAHGVLLGIAVVCFIIPVGAEWQLLARMNFWWLAVFLTPFAIAGVVKTKLKQLGEK